MDLRSAKKQQTTAYHIPQASAVNPMITPGYSIDKTNIGNVPELKLHEKTSSLRSINDDLVSLSKSDAESYASSKKVVKIKKGDKLFIYPTGSTVVKKEQKPKQIVE